jgi:hypothetical protein
VEANNGDMEAFLESRRLTVGPWRVLLRPVVTVRSHYFDEEADSDPDLLSIKMKGSIRILILFGLKVKNRIRIRIKVKNQIRILNNTYDCYDWCKMVANIFW